MSSRCDALGLNKEQKRIYARCYEEARKYFNLQKGWVLHHKDVQLQNTDIDRYIHWNIEDLESMTKSEHMRLHALLGWKESPTSRIVSGERNGMYGRGYLLQGEKNGMYDVHRFGEESPMWGKHHSESAKAKMSAKKKGRTWKLVDGKRVWYDKT